MKQHIMLTLDEELIAKLRKENNMSSLINRILSKYFQERDLENMTEEQAKARLEELDILIEAQNKVKQLRKERMEKNGSS